MADLIKLKRSAVAAKVPLTTDLELGEIAINTFDGKLFVKQDNGTESIVEMAKAIHTHSRSVLIEVSEDSVQTTDNTQTDVSSVVINTGTQRIIVANVRGFQSSTNDTVWRHMTLCVKNVSGTATLVGGVASSSGYDSGASTWDISVTVTGGSAVFKVTGETSKTIDWTITTETY